MIEKVLDTSMFALIDNISIIFTRHFAHTRVIYLPSLPVELRTLLLLPRVIDVVISVKKMSC